MTRLAYRLSVAPALEVFRPEIEHTCTFLERCHSLVRDTGASAVLHYGPDAPNGAVHVPNALFPHGVRLDADGIHPMHDVLERHVDGQVTGLFPMPPRGPGLAYDALGLIFLLLTRLEERGHPARDRYGRFPRAAALAVRRTGKAGPLADEAARDVAAALFGRTDPPIATSYAAYVTHDVDRLRGYHRLHEPLRQAAGDFLKRGRPMGALNRLADGYASGEPWHSARAIMAATESRKLKSRFYFMGPSHHPMDSPYAATMPRLLHALGQEIAARGHILGFHPGFETPSDPQTWQAQKSGLERALGQKVTEGRQHVLRYAAENTPDIWNDAGMALDASLAWPEASGFRNGTCRRHAAYSLRGRRTLALDQVATAVMDFGLFGGKYRDLSIADALAEAKAVNAICRRHGGTFVILHHTGQLRAPQSTFFERVLEIAA